MRLVYVTADNAREKNCDIWRCENPAQALRQIGHPAYLVTADEFVKRSAAVDLELQRADLIVVERNLFGSVLTATAYWIASGKTIIYDCDDALNLIPPTNPAYNFWILGLVNDTQGKLIIKPGLAPLIEREYGLKMIEAATMPSRLLMQDLAPYTHPFYLPNYIDTRTYLSAERESHEGIVIGWGGSASHLQSFSGSGILTALLHVCQQRPQVKVVICGDDKRIFHHLPVKNKEIRPWVSFGDWPRQLAGFDIGLAPLSGLFDDHRSTLKPMEYLTMGIPFVASRSPAYAELYSIQPDNFVDNTVEAWEAALLDRVDHLDAYWGAALESQPFALEQDLFANAPRIAAVYEEVLYGHR